MDMIGHAGTKRGFCNLAGTRHVVKVASITRAKWFAVPILAFAAVVTQMLVVNESRGEERPATKKDSPAAPKPTEIAFGSSGVGKGDIEQAINNLGNTSFTVREKASRVLWNAGVAAEPALERAVQETDDFEVANRAQQLLQSFQAGIYADTPADIVVLINRYRLGNLSIKQSAAQRLKEKGKIDLVRRLIAKETNPFVREQLSQMMFGGGSPFGDAYISGAARRPMRRPVDASQIAMEARVRLAQRDFDGAERLLRSASNDASLRDYAALLLSRSTLDAAIAQLRGNLKPDDEAGQRRLTWMLRAKGDLPGALAAARLVKDNDLVEGLLAEMADWKELAKLVAKADMEKMPANADGGQRLARIIAFRHLAGEKEACDLAVATALKMLKQPQFRYGYLLNALVLNERVEQVLQASQAEDVRTAFDLLAAQNRMKEALRLIKVDVPIPAKIDWAAWLKDGKQAVVPERILLACQVLRVLHTAGEENQANELSTAVLAVIADKLPENGWSTFVTKLVELEVVTGRAATLDALAAKVLGLDLDNPDVVIAGLYRDQDVAAVLIWKALRKQFPAEDRTTALKHLRRLLTGKPDAAAVDEIRHLMLRIEPQLEAVSAEDSPDDETSDPRARKLLALTTLFHRYEQSKLSSKYLARIGTAGVAAQTLIDVGNLYSQEKKWGEAAKAYEAAWTKDRRSASALYLLGWAQSKNGEETEGRKRMELALMIPLGDGESRHDLLQTLLRLHQDDEAARQRQWILRLVAPHDRSIVQALMESGEIAAEKTDATGTAAIWQRVAMELVSGNTVLSERRYYLQPPVAAHSARARELLREGKTAEAIAEMHQAEAIQPANIQIALDCAADLQKHGAGAEVEAIYQRMLAAHETLCRDFPRSGTYHNDLAWLAANLDRDLDKALAHAQRAVELEPQAASILDTLAEVHFRRGNRAEAVRLTKRCLEMEPDGEHYKKQLVRFEGK